MCLYIFTTAKERAAHGDFDFFFFGHCANHGQKIRESLRNPISIPSRRRHNFGHNNSEQNRKIIESCENNSNGWKKMRNVSFIQIFIWVVVVVVVVTVDAVVRLWKDVTLASYLG
jgi:hypothetical protein